MEMVAAVGEMFNVCRAAVMYRVCVHTRTCFVMVGTPPIQTLPIIYMISQPFNHIRTANHKTSINLASVASSKASIDSDKQARKRIRPISSS